ncbi:MAG: glycosyltransferase [Cyclobacteriaceae bacterium]
MDSKDCLPISVIIPTFNGGHKISSLLQSLENQNTTNFEVIVVIDGSTDNTIGILNALSFSNFRLKITNQQNSGRSISRNNGAKLAKNDLLLFVDDDMRLEKGVLAFHLEHHKNCPDTILVGNALEDDKNTTSDVQQYKRHLSTIWMKGLSVTYKKLNQPFITSAHFSIPKTLFFNLGGFDDRLSDAEDYDLAIRAKATNVDIYFNPKLFGWHDEFITAQSYLQRLKQYAKSNNQLAEINPGVGATQKETSLIAKAVYYFFSFRFWLLLIDSESLCWLPKSIRYKIYDFIFHSQSVIYCERKN